jgi:hypothetical protein
MVDQKGLMKPLNAMNLEISEHAPGIILAHEADTKREYGRFRGEFLVADGQRIAKKRSRLADLSLRN